MLYKRRLKKIIEQMKRKSPGFTLAKIAGVLEIEPSYLSRFLSDSQIHFSDDLLCRLLSELQLSAEEMDYVFLLKEYDRTEHPERKIYLSAKIQSHRFSYWKHELSLLKKQLIEILDVIEKANL